MKNKSTLLISLFLIATVAFVGCKKEEEKKAELPSEQQEAVADIGWAYVGSYFSQMNEIFLPMLDGSGWKKDSKAPPAGWTGPDAAGWYTYDYTTYSYQVRFHPGDPWAEPPGDFWQVEWKWDYYDTTNYQLEYYARCAYADEGADTTHIEGEWRLDFYLLYEGQDFSYTFTLSYDNVAVAYDDYEGHFVLECEYTYSSTTTGEPATTSLTGEFTFESSGVGTGSISADGIEIVRYTFNCVEGGYYTLLYENWEIEHEFGSCSK